MKASITSFLLVVILFASCQKEKCETCKRTWTHTSHVENQQGEIMGEYHSWNGNEETFVVCDESDIKNAEQRIDTKLREPADSGMVKVTFGVAKCDCN